MSVLTTCTECEVLFDTWAWRVENICEDCETEREKIK